MTKNELVSELSKRSSMTQGSVEKLLAAFVSVVAEKLQAGEKVAVSGFGTFDVGVRKARRGVNPQTGAAITIPEMKLPRFRAGERLKRALR